MSTSTRRTAIGQLRERGYVVERNFVPAQNLIRLNDAARAQLAARTAPVEFEADLRYPGAPQSHAAAGGETVRRLLDAYGRDPEFAAWATAPSVRQWMDTYFAEDVLMSRASGALGGMTERQMRARSSTPGNGNSTRKLSRRRKASSRLRLRFVARTISPPWFSIRWSR